MVKTNRCISPFFGVFRFFFRHSSSYHPVISRVAANPSRILRCFRTKLNRRFLSGVFVRTIPDPAMAAFLELKSRNNCIKTALQRVHYTEAMEEGNQMFYAETGRSRETLAMKAKTWSSERPSAAFVDRNRCAQRVPAWVMLQIRREAPSITLVWGVLMLKSERRVRSYVPSNPILGLYRYYEQWWRLLLSLWWLSELLYVPILARRALKASQSLGLTNTQVVWALPACPIFVLYPSFPSIVSYCFSSTRLSVYVHTDT